ncbi:MAG TPA: glycosyl hydrolase family 28-related protein [Thermoleophilia bacterium]|nr:glycosyl hydrolase family 28-related protein [Thermoleophilia bacterium]
MKRIRAGLTITLLLMCVEQILAQSALANVLSVTGPTLVSSYAVDHPGRHANDSRLATRWAARTSGYPQWWQVDLGRRARITLVRIDWFLAATHSYRYSIRLSNDGATWTTAVDRSKRSSFGITKDGLAADARYLRVIVLGCRTSDGTKASASVSELRVYGPTPVFNVKDMGAKGDGVTNDTAAIDAAVARARRFRGVVYLPAGAYAYRGTLTVPDRVHIRGAGIYDQGTARGGGGTWLKAALRWGSRVFVEQLLVGDEGPFRPVPRGSSAAGPDTRAHGSHDNRFSFVRFKGGGLDLGVNFGRGWTTATNPLRKYDMVRTIFNDCEWEAPPGEPGSRPPLLNLWIDSRPGGARVSGNRWNRNHFGVKNSTGRYGVGRTIIIQPAPTTPSTGRASDPDTGPRVGLSVVPGVGSNLDATSWNRYFRWRQVDHGFSDNRFVDSLFEYSDWYPLNFCDWARLYSMWHGIFYGGNPSYGGWGNPPGSQWVNIPDRMWNRGVQVVRSYNKGGVRYNNGVSEVHKSARYIDSTMATGKLTNMGGRYGNVVRGSFSNNTRPRTLIFPAGGQWDWTGSRTDYTPSPYDP